MTPATANLIVRNAGGPGVSDSALIREARATDHFPETDAELLTILRAAEKRLRGAALGGIRAATARRHKKEDRDDLVEFFAAQVQKKADAAKARKGEGWHGTIDRRVNATIAAARKTGDYTSLLALGRELEDLK